MSVERTSAALDRGEVCGTKRSSTSVTVTLLQSTDLPDSARKNAAGVVPPDTARKPFALRSIAAASLPATSFGQRLRQLGPRGEFVPGGGCRRGGLHALSCHVRPSRSMSAIDADGPQVPAV